MQNTYKRATSFFILGVLAVQGATSLGFDTNKNPADYIAQVSASENIISDEASLLSIDELKALIEAKEAAEAAEAAAIDEEETPIDLTSAPVEIIEEVTEETVQEEITEEVVEEAVTEELTEEISDAEAAAKTLTDGEILKIFVQNKARFSENETFMNAWEALSVGYTQKTADEIYEAKLAFLTVYFELTNGVTKNTSFDLEYMGVASDVFEDKIMEYLDARDATEVQYSNARKLVRMVEMFNAIDADNIGMQADMQKSITTQFGRVLNNL